jgi:hypothetical protein
MNQSPESPSFFLPGGPFPSLSMDQPELGHTPIATIANDHGRQEIPAEQSEEELTRLRRELEVAKKALEVEVARNQGASASGADAPPKDHGSTAPQRVKVSGGVKFVLVELDPKVRVTGSTWNPR